MALPGKIDLNDLLVFEAVADAGGFTAAARRLDIATAKVSVEIGRLESRLGVSLFNRTTRKVVLTDAGQALFEECRPLLLGLGDAIERAGAGKEELTGTLRISSTVDHATLSLGPALTQFARMHPRLTIDLRTNDRVVSLVEEGIDASIRMGWLRDSSHRAVKLGEFAQYVVAAPAYIAKFPAPREPGDLLALDWVALTLLPKPLSWEFSSGDGEVRTIQVKSRLRVDSPGVLRTVVAHQGGVSVMDQLNAEEGIKTGELVRLLPSWALPRGGIHAVFVPGRQIPAKVRVFIEFYKRYLTAGSAR